MEQYENKIMFLLIFRHEKNEKIEKNLMESNTKKAKF